jgi:alanyl-tRNA synthetase
MSDLEFVGRTRRHLTFFEMLGNFSFGDYFKEEAIAWAWEFLIQVMAVDRTRLLVSVHKDDREAYKLWREKIGLADDRIFKLGDDTNFWGPAGNSGPCGPCSEVYYDLGPKYSCGRKDCSPGCDCDRYMELWNLVFPQFDQAQSGERRPLKNRGVDTGMGYERLVSVIQKKETNFETDLFAPITAEIMARVGQKATWDREQTVQVNVIADHLRALVFAIADGVIPSNEERGYVLRRLLRRAVRFGRNLGIRDPFLFDLVPRTVQIFSAAYPELTGRREAIALVVKAEEERFLATLDKGLALLAELLARRRSISAEDAFKLYDTYGFPLELTREIAAEKKIAIDEAGFSARLEQAKEQSRQKTKFTLKGAWKILKEGSGSFVGYDRLESDTEILRYNEHGKELELVLELSPFYAEAGGQVGDQGEIAGSDFRLRVQDTYLFQGMTVCHCRVESGEFSPGPVRARVNVEARRETARAHTATHMLHAALRQILGEHARQEGSFVEPGRLRFDFMHFKPLSADELDMVENIVNDKILAGIKVVKLETSLDEARKMGAMALFGEKYGARVRVVKIADYSTELCAGTHLDNTAEVGLFKITAQESAAAGTRRIEAIVGKRLFQELRREDNTLRALRDLLGTDQEPAKKVAELLDRIRELEKTGQADKMKIARAEAERLIKKAADREYLLEGFQDFGIDGLRMIADIVREKTKNLVGILYEENKGRLNYLVFVTPDLASTHPAGDIVKELRGIWGGGGGGRPHLAEGGGADPAKLTQVAQYLTNFHKT